MKLLSCPCQFFVAAKGSVKNNFQEEELSHASMAFVRLVVAEAATVYQEPQILEN